jgi:hypothetical protein
LERASREAEPNRQGMALTRHKENERYDNARNQKRAAERRH